MRQSQRFTVPMMNRTMFGFAFPAALSLRRVVDVTSLQSLSKHQQLRTRPRRALSHVFCMSTTTSNGGILAGSTVGFVGLGVMGLPMALNLVANGARLVVWNRSESRSGELSKLAPQGMVRTASSAAEVVDATDITYSMLSTPDAVRAVLHGAGGAFSALAPGKAFVDCSTLEEGDMMISASEANKRGASFMEAPVSGSKGPAEQGSLIFLCGGERALFDKVEPALSVMGKKSFFLGPVGAGTRMKLVVNQVMGTALVALAEGMALAEAVDIKTNDLLDVLDVGATGNPMFKLKGPGMSATQRKYPTNFPLEHALKDMRFAQGLGEAHGVDMSVSKAATDLYGKADDLGLGREDFAAVIESVRAASKVVSKA